MSCISETNPFWGVGVDGLVFNDLSFISFLPFYYVIAIGLDDGYL